MEELRGHRGAQLVLIAALLPLCWLGMMIVHELGHVLGGVATGGHVERVVLHPMTISRTDVAPNPQPRIVTWAGPVIGVLLPLLVLAAWWRLRLPGLHLCRFFAGFCLIANGLYLAMGSFDRVGDAGDLLRHGAASWQLWLFGLVTVPAGFVLWHGQGRHFGLGKEAMPVAPRAAVVTVLLLVLVVVLELLLSPRE